MLIHRNSNVIAHTEFGDLDVIYQLVEDEEVTESMSSKAFDLAQFTQREWGLVADLIYAHYKHAQMNEWLSFWDVPANLSRGEVLKSLRSVQLVVDTDVTASVFIDPPWDPEHKLDLTFDGSITEINGEPFEVVNGVLVFT